MVGSRISHYRLTQQLGAGGMGIVYKAHDESLDRTVALKFFPFDSLPSDRKKARFVREARLAARLNHANIATVYEIGETEGGQAFIAMEFVEGDTLRTVIGGGPLKLDKALAMGGKQPPHLLRDVYEWFTEGFQTPDLKEARALLNE